MHTIDDTLKVAADATGLLRLERTGSAKGHADFHVAANSLRICTKDYRDVLNIVSGNVGIGTTEPRAKLEVAGDALLGALNVSGPLTVGGNAGIGLNPEANRKFQVHSTDADERITFSGNYNGKNQNSDSPKLTFAGQYQTAGVSIQGINVTGHGLKRMAFFTHNAQDYTTESEVMSITPAGNVGIGTTEPQSKLAVNGIITAKDTKVSVEGWPDNVLGDEYKLGSLDDLQSFIREHKHLPDIPSAQDARRQGVKVGDMLAKMLGKIEELTLHMISLKKENETLKERVSALDCGA